MQETCADQVRVCDDQGERPAQQPNPPSPAEPGHGSGIGLECVEIYRWSNECAGDRDSSRGCLAQDSAQGQAEASTVSGCVRNNQCQDDACANTMYAAEIRACETPVPEPYFGCLEPNTDRLSARR